MQRRSFLSMSGTALLGWMNAVNTFASKNTNPWKTAIGLNGFESGTRKYNITYPIWEILDFASNHQFDGVELVSNWPMGGYPQADEKERIEALRRLYDCFGLQIFSIQLSAGGALSPNPDERRQWLETIQNRARFAKSVGCDCIGLWPGGGLRGQTISQAIEHLSSSFRKVGEIVADLGLLASFEIEPPFVFNTEEHLKQILEQTGHPAVKTMYDPSHYDLMNGSTGKPHEMLERIGVENIGYVHLTDTDGTLRDGGTSKHLPCGDGHVDIHKSLKTLKDGGFKGWIMIDAWEVPDAYEACQKGKKAIDRLNS